MCGDCNFPMPKKENMKPEKKTYYFGEWVPISDSPGEPEYEAAMVYLLAWKKYILMKLEPEYEYIDEQIIYRPPFPIDSLLGHLPSTLGIKINTKGPVNEYSPPCGPTPLGRP